MPGGNGCTLNTYHVRPRSRGSVTLRSADPLAPPVIDVNAFADPYDLARTVDGIVLCREIMAQKAFAPFVSREHLPGAATRSRADLEVFARASVSAPLRSARARRAEPLFGLETGNKRERPATATPARFHGALAVPVGL